MVDQKANVNPAQRPASPSAAERKRIPMSVPRRRLEAPEIPGFRLYWFLEKNVPRALQAGYEMVRDSEVALNQFNVGTESSVSGNQDLGGNVRLVAGTGEDGKAEHLVLMKIRQEWYLEDQQLIAEKNAQILSAIFRDEKVVGSEGQSEDDKSKSYVKTALLNRPKRR